MNGEMPAAFNPKIWWIQLGLNDLGRMQCSEEIVELGILRVVEEILERKPKAKVVINSLLPMANLRGGLMPGKTAYMDSFQQAKGRMPASHYAQRPNRPARPSLTGDEGGNRRNLGEGVRKSNVRGEPSAEQGGLISGQHRELFGLFKHHSKTKDVQMRDHQFVQKKYRPIVHKERKLPLWTSITAINDQLKKFCAKHDRVTSLMPLIFLPKRKKPMSGHSIAAPLRCEGIRPKQDIDNGKKPLSNEPLECSRNLRRRLPKSRLGRFHMFEEWA